MGQAKEGILKKIQIFILRNRLKTLPDNDLTE
jgi:hypothetical protein